MYPRAATMACRNLPSMANGWPPGVHYDREGEFQSAMVIAADAYGKLYVSDWGNSRIQVFDSDGTYLDAWGLRGTGLGELVTPTGLKVDGDGNLWVVDRGNSRVLKLTGDGEILAKWGSEGYSHGQLGVRTSIAIDGDGNFYVAEVEASRVQIFSSTGEFLPEPAPGLLSGPHGLAFDSVGNLYVGDTRNNYVKKFRVADPP